MFPLAGKVRDFVYLVRPAKLSRVFRVTQMAAIVMEFQRVPIPRRLSCVASTHPANPLPNRFLQLPQHRFLQLWLRIPHLVQRLHSQKMFPSVNNCFFILVEKSFTHVCFHYRRCLRDPRWCIIVRERGRVMFTKRLLHSCPRFSKGSRWRSLWRRFKEQFS